MLCCKALICLGFLFFAVSSASAFSQKIGLRSDTPSPPRHASTLQAAEPAAAHSSAIWTEEQLLDYAQDQGVSLSFSTLGPGYRAVARAKHNESIILGYCEGFLRPGGQVLHLDKMEVFQKMVSKARDTSPETFNKRGTIFGIGILLGFMCLLHGRENGYSVGEFLAIDDEESQHRKLVKYYERSGFRIIKYVGDDFKDIPDRMLWGGCGTLMREQIDSLLQNWTQLFERASKARS